MLAAAQCAGRVSAHSTHSQLLVCACHPRRLSATRLSSPARPLSRAAHCSTASQPLARVYAFRSMLRSIAAYAQKSNDADHTAALAVCTFIRRNCHIRRPRCRSAAGAPLVPLHLHTCSTPRRGTTAWVTRHRLAAINPNVTVLIAQPRRPRRKFSTRQSESNNVMLVFSNQRTMARRAV